MTPFWKRTIYNFVIMIALAAIGLFGSRLLFKNDEKQQVKVADIEAKVLTVHYTTDSGFLYGHTVCEYGNERKIISFRGFLPVVPNDKWKLKWEDGQFVFKELINEN